MNITIDGPGGSGLRDVKYEKRKTYLENQSYYSY